MDILPAAPTTGEQLRDEALNLLRVRRRDLINECTAAALRAALAGGEVTADDVRALVTIPPEINPVFMGTVLRDLADAGILRRTCYRPSTRPAAHARPLAVWVLADPAAARARLALHPVTGGSRG